MRSKPRAKAAPPVPHSSYPTALPPLDTDQRYSLPEACAYLRMSRTNLWARAKRGDLVVIREGRRTYVPGSEITRLSRPPVAEA